MIFFSAKRHAKNAGLRRHRNCHGFDHQRALQQGRHSPAISGKGEGDGTIPATKNPIRNFECILKFKDTHENHLRIFGVQILDVVYDSVAEKNIISNKSH